MKLESGRRPKAHAWLAAALLAVAAPAVPASHASGEQTQMNAKDAKSPKKLTDAQIHGAIDREMLLNANVRLHRVAAEVKEGVVRLTGEVDNLLAKQRAVEVAQTIKGVRSVIDQIAVKTPLRADEKLTKDVKDALFYDPATESYEVDVKATRGTVRLTGTVDSYHERELAAEVAAGVRGVLEVRNNIVARPTEMRTDHDIEEDIERMLGASVRIDDKLIDVDVNDGKVELTGTVGSAAERRRARGIAWVAGVKSVDDDGLKVEWWARDRMQRDRTKARADVAIATSIRDAFVYDPRVFSMNPTIEVSGGVVTLTGVVPNLRAKRAAADTARNTMGVWRVRNLLRVRPETQPTDQAIETAVTSALLRDPFVERFDVTVDVVNGHVYLYGIADSRFERDRAGYLAEIAKGAIAVGNHIEVRDSALTMNDWELEQNINDEMFWSPFVDADEVHVEVEKGVATLSGVVDDLHERSKARENAFEGGAVAVDNNLRVGR